MYALKRIVAFSVDYISMLFISTALYGYVAKVLNPVLVKIELMEGYAHYALSTGVLMILPILIIGTLSGLLGWTPGKLICCLRVHNHSGRPPGVIQGILREVVKVIGTSFMFFGTLWALYGIITSEQTFYDDWIGTTVTDLKPTGLTDTQKKWRQFRNEERSRK
jgi:uncharacterized RDD family membrane protein YckC